MDEYRDPMQFGTAAEIADEIAYEHSLTKPSRSPAEILRAAAARARTHPFADRRLCFAVADWLDADAAKIDGDKSIAITWHYACALAVARALLPTEETQT